MIGFADAPFLVPVKGLDDTFITNIACGPQHSIAIDSRGQVDGLLYAPLF